MHERGTRSPRTDRGQRGAESVRTSFLLAVDNSPPTRLTAARPRLLPRDGPGPVVRPVGPAAAPPGERPRDREICLLSGQKPRLLEGAVRLVRPRRPRPLSGDGSAGADRSPLRPGPRRLSRGRPRGRPVALLFRLVGTGRGPSWTASGARRSSRTRPGSGSSQKGWHRCASFASSAKTAQPMDGWAPMGPRGWNRRRPLSRDGSGHPLVGIVGSFWSRPPPPLDGWAPAYENRRPPAARTL